MVCWEHDLYGDGRNAHGDELRWLLEAEAVDEDEDEERHRLSSASEELDEMVDVVESQESTRVILIVVSATGMFEVGDVKKYMLILGGSGGC